MSVVLSLIPVAMIFGIFALFYAFFFLLKCWSHSGDPAGHSDVGSLEEHVTVVVDLQEEDEEDGDGGRECPVCLSAFEEGEALWRINRCKHLFHAPCIERWIHVRSTCPVCRACILPAGPSPVVPEAAAPPRICHRQGLTASSGLL